MAITSHGRYCITGIVQYRICLHDDLKWNFLNISHSGTGANLMWTSYPIFSGATIKLTLDILQFCLHAGLSEKSSYGVLTALESVQAVTCNDYTLHRVTTISACWHWWAGLGAALYTALPRADQRHCGVTPPNLATARARPTS